MISPPFVSENKKDIETLSTVNIIQLNTLKINIKVRLEVLYPTCKTFH